MNKKKHADYLSFKYIGMLHGNEFIFIVEETVYLILLLLCGQRKEI